MNITVFSFTEKGDMLNRKIGKIAGDFTMEAFYRADMTDRLAERTRLAFEKADAIIFIGGAGIAVRAIAPYIVNKTTDPAVIVCDEGGSFVIPILSGHIGGANELAERIGTFIGAVPVITTATDINGVWAVDTWAVKKGFHILNSEEIKHISSAMLRGEDIGLLADINIDDKMPDNLILNDINTKCGIVISPYIKKPYKHTLNLVPECISIGVGSKRAADENALLSLFHNVIERENISIYSIENVATIDIKGNEPVVLRLCESLRAELKIYTFEELNRVKGNFTSSQFVRAVTGTDNVCERSAVAAAENGSIIVPKTCGSGVTLAMAINDKKEIS